MTVTLNQFLNDVLPPVAPYFVAVEAFNNILCQDIPHMEAVAAANAHANMYYTPASFIPNAEHRDNKSLTARKAYVLDIDIRDDKEDHFHTFADAMKAVQDLLDSGVLPRYAYMVSSGAGLHVYWLSIDAYDLVTWTHINDRFLDVVKEHADPRIVSDAPTTKRASGMFRIPTTFNVKHGDPLPCSILDGCGEHMPAEWTAYLFERTRIGYETDSAVLGTQGALAAPTPSHARSGGSSSLGMFSAPVRKRVNLLQEGCAVSRLAWDKPDELSEAGWLTMAKIMAHSENGHSEFHALSKLSPTQYDVAETDRKFEHAKTQHSGVRCDRMRETMNNGQTDLCQGCEFFNPLALNKGSPLKAAEVKPEAPAPAAAPEPTVETLESTNWTINIKREHNTQIPVWLTTPGDDFLIDNGTLGSAGVYDAQTNKHIVRPVKIAYTPFWMGRAWGSAEKDGTAGENNMDQWFVVSRDTGKIEIFDLKTSTGSDAATFAREARAHGVMLHPQCTPDALGAYLKDTTFRARARGVTHKSFGWPENDETGFIIGETMYRGGGQAEHIKLDGAAKKFHKKNNLRLAGDPDKCLELFQMYTRPEVDKVARFAVLLGLASPLLTFVANNTFAVLFYGFGGSGKSSVQLFIDSMWGCPEGSTITNDDTDLGRKTATAAYNSIPVTWDEATVKEGSEMGKFLMELTARGRRTAMTSDGEVRDTEIKAKTMVIMSSNKTVKEFIRGENAEAEAARSRVLQLDFPRSAIPIKQEPFATYVSTFGEDIDKNYGYLGAMFVDHIMKDLPRWKQRVRDVKKKLQGQKDDALDRYKDAGVAAAYVAEEIVKELGWIDMNSSWADDFEVQNRVNRAANLAREKGGVGSSLYDLGAGKDFHSYFNAMRQRSPGSFPHSHNGGPTPSSTSWQSYMGLIWTAADGKDPADRTVELREDHIQYFVSKTALEAYCLSQKRMGGVEDNPDFLVAGWKREGVNIERVQFDPGQFVHSLSGSQPTPHYRIIVK